MSDLPLQTLDDTIATIRNPTIRYYAEGGYALLSFTINAVRSAWEQAKPWLQALGTRICLSCRQFSVRISFLYTCVRDFFFPIPPTSEEKIHNKLQALLTAKNKGEVAALLTLGNDKEGLSKTELKDLFNTYLETKKHISEEYRQLFCELMEKIADADTLEEIDACEETIREHRDEIKNLVDQDGRKDRVPQEMIDLLGLRKEKSGLLDSFCHAFRKPHADLRKLLDPMYGESYKLSEDDLRVLLKHPNAFRQTKVAQKIRALENARRRSNSPLSFLESSVVQKLNKTENQFKELYRSQLSAKLTNIDNEFNDELPDNFAFKMENKRFIKKYVRGRIKATLGRASRCTPDRYKQWMPQIVRSYKQLISCYKEAREQSRVQKRHTTASQDLLKQHPDCLLPYQILQKQLPYQNSQQDLASDGKKNLLEKRLFQAANDFYDHIGEHLTEESLSKALSLWHQDLQKIWLAHLPMQQEEQILAVCDPLEQRQIMARCFSEWIEERTGLSCRLSPKQFTAITVPDRNLDRAHAMETLKTHLKEPMEKWRKKRIQTQIKLQQKEKFQSILNDPTSSLHLQEQFPESDPRRFGISVLTSFHRFADTSYTGGRDLLKELTAFLPRFHDATTINEKCKIVYELEANTSLHSLYETKYYLSEFCRCIIAQCERTQTVPQEIQRIVLEQFDPQHIRNDEYFALFIRMTLAHFKNGETIRVSETQRRYLLQINALSHEPQSLTWTIAELGNLPFEGKFLEALGTKIHQESPLWLEGLDEETLQRTFQERTSNNINQRELLDALRAVSDDALRFCLLGDVTQFYHLWQHQESEAIRRAFLSLYQQDPSSRGGLLQHIQNKIGYGQSYLQKENSCAPTETGFYRDILSEIKPSDQANELWLQQRNRELLGSHKASVVLLGASRELARLTRQWHRSLQQQTKEAYYELLKYKMTYQALRREFYPQKEDPKGFLKNAVDMAENALLRQPDFQESFRLTPEELALNDQRVPQFLNCQMPADHFIMEHLTQSYLLEKMVGQDSKPLPPLWIQEKPQQGFHTLSYGTQPKYVIALRSGVIYTDGEQSEMLPAQLYNNSGIRALGFHKLLFIKGTDNVYTYYSKSAKQNAEAQLKITLEEGIPIVQQRLPTQFGSPDLQWVQLLQTKDAKFPSAILLRMGIQSFWMDQNNRVYGYDATGDLTAIFQLDSQKNCINMQRRNGDFFMISDPKHPENKTLQTFYNQILRVFPREEILVHQSQRSLWIPGLDLTLSLKNNGYFGASHWIAEKPGMKEMAVDESDCEKGYLSLVLPKGADDRESLEDQLLIAENRLRRGMETQTPSFKTRKNLRENIARQKNNLSQAEGRKGIIVLDNPQIGPLGHIELAVAHDHTLSATDVRGALYLIKQQDLWFTQTREWIQEQKDKHATSDHFDPQEIVTWMRQHVKGSPFQEMETSVLQRWVLTTILPLSSLWLAPNVLQILEQLEKLREEAQTTFTLKRMEEMAHRAGVKPLDPTTKQELQKIARNSPPALKLCCLGTLLKNAQQERTLLSKKPSGGSLTEVQDIIQEIQDLNSQIEEVEIDDAEFEKYGSALYRLFPDRRPQTSSYHPLRISEKAISLAKKFDTIARHSLLERLHLEPTIAATRKPLETLVSEEQKAFIHSFREHSPEQVRGFYLEEFGIFYEKALLSEFQIPKTDLKVKREKEYVPRGLFGLSRQDIRDLLSLLTNQGILEQPRGDISYSVSAKQGCHPLQTLDRKMIETHLTAKGLKEPAKIIQKLQAFIANAAHAGFTFTFANGAQELVETALATEKALHKKEIQLAEDFLREKLPAHKPFEEALVSLKSAWLTGMAKELSRDLDALQRALTRYLVHKTELKHIENVENASLTGERNKIELLGTRRQYNTHFLLTEGTTESEREEQLLQRAFLLFEEEYGARCNPMQHALFRSLLLDPSLAERGFDAIQARMGFGKTALLPIMALVRVARNQRINNPSERYLPIYIVPKAVIKDNTGSFHTRLSHILGSHAIQDQEFSRYQINNDDIHASLQLIRADLQDRLTFYQQALREGTVLIQSPEIRGSMEAQELEFGRMLTQDRYNGDMKTLCIECKILLGNIRGMKSYTVFDELDDTQDFKSRKVNYTCGDEEPIQENTLLHLRQIVPWLEQRKDCSNLAQLATDLCDLLGLREDETVQNYILDASQDYRAIASYSLEDKEKIFLIRALVQDPYMLSLATSKKPSTHYGVRRIDQGDKKVYSFDALSKAPLLIAVPYEGTNTPKGLSVYDNTEVAAIATMRYYNSLETLFDKEHHLRFLMTQVHDHKLSENIENLAPEGCIDMLEELEQRIGGDRTKAEEEFFKNFMKNPNEKFRQFFGAAVCATQIRSNTQCTKSDRYEMGSIENIYKGCSGTIGGTSSYFTREKVDPNADGKLSLEIMGRDENQTVAVLEEVATGDYLQNTLANLLEHAQSNTRAIIDAAGLCKSKDGLPETIVRELWKQLPRSNVSYIQGIIYYDRHGVKRLYKGGDNPGDLCSTEIELAAIANQQAYFSFYGQKNTRGSDIKQADGAHALVTLDENVSNSDAKQAVLRFRSLVNRSSKQSFSFAITPRARDIILINRPLSRKAREEQRAHGGVLEGPSFLQMMKIAWRYIRSGVAMTPEEMVQALEPILENTTPPLSVRDIANYLRTQERTIEQQNALTIFKQELAAHVKQAAAAVERLLLQTIDPIRSEKDRTTYVDFLTQRNEIVAFAEMSILELQNKYGQGREKMTRDEFIQRQYFQTMEKLGRLYGLIPRRHSISSFFSERVRHSIQRFELRYPRDVSVHIVSGNLESDGMVEVEALALNELQTEVDAQIQSLTETEIHVEPPRNRPSYAMTTKPHRTANLDFLNSQSLPHAHELAWMNHLIHGTNRDRLCISPSLQEYNIVSRFVVYQKDKDKNRCIFITQEEAALFVSSKSQSGELHDLRTSVSSIPLVQTAQYLSWQKEESNCTSFPYTPDSLWNRNCPVFIEEKGDMHPRLKHNDLSCLRKTLAYGVSQPGSCRWTINYQEKTISIQINQEPPIVVQIPSFTHTYASELFQTRWKKPTSPNTYEGSISDNIYREIENKYSSRALSNLETSISKKREEIANLENRSRILTQKFNRTIGEEQELSDLPGLLATKEEELTKEVKDQEERLNFLPQAQEAYLFFLQFYWLEVSCVESLKKAGLLLRSFFNLFRLDEFFTNPNKSEDIIELSWDSPKCLALRSEVCAYREAIDPSNVEQQNSDKFTQFLTWVTERSQDVCTRKENQ